MLGDTIIKLIADGAVVPVIIVGVFSLLFLIPKGYKFAAYSRILMAGLTAFLLARLLGSIFQPELERPFELLGAQAGALYLDNPGFPSDHALFTMAITLAVWFETRRKWLSMTLLTCTLLVCVGRVLALVHTPLDVVAGVMIACIGGLWYLQRPKVSEKAKT